MTNDRPSKYQRCWCCELMVVKWQAALGNLRICERCWRRIKRVDGRTAGNAIHDALMEE